VIEYDRQTMLPDSSVLIYRPNLRVKTVYLYSILQCSR